MAAYWVGAGGSDGLGMTLSEIHLSYSTLLQNLKNREIRRENTLAMFLVSFSVFVYVSYCLHRYSEMELIAQNRYHFFKETPAFSANSKSVSALFMTDLLLSSMEC